MAGTSSVILLIELNSQSRTVYAKALREAGFAVIVVSNTVAALDALTDLTPQIIIASFDARTHDECFALCERLLTDPRTRSVPILLTSPGISAEDLERATDIKVLGIAIGPQDGAKMTSAVRGVLAVSETASMSKPARRVRRSS